MITVTEAATLVGVNPSTARRWAEAARQRGDPHLTETVRGYMAPEWWWRQEATKRTPRRPRKGSGEGNR